MTAHDPKDASAAVVLERFRCAAFEITDIDGIAIIGRPAIDAAGLAHHPVSVADGCMKADTMQFVVIGGGRLTRDRRAYECNNSHGHGEWIGHIHLLVRLVFVASAAKPLRHGSGTMKDWARRALLTTNIKFIGA
jgi:hypothetical protein